MYMSSKSADDQYTSNYLPVLIFIANSVNRIAYVINASAYIRHFALLISTFAGGYEVVKSVLYGSCVIKGSFHNIAVWINTTVQHH